MSRRTITIELRPADAEWLKLQLQQMADLAETERQAARPDRIIRAIYAALPTSNR